MRVLIAICVSGLGYLNAFAAEPAVPPVLDDWRPWVLEGSAQVCPLVQSGERACLWPGVLELNLDAQGGSFSQPVRVYKDGKLRLPGGSESSWPHEVTVNGQAQPVLSENGNPVLLLMPGQARIEGRFRWSKLPEQLQIPTHDPVRLNLDGEFVPAPEREGESLWLGRRLSESSEAQSLDIRVNRRLQDGLPPILTTQINLSVSGEGREVKIGPVLLNGFAPLALSGDLSARLLSDGSLTVQLKPGEWVLNLSARGEAPLSEISLPARAPVVAGALPEAGLQWPEEETLSVASDASFRVLQPSGLPSIDPNQADVPQAWRNEPAFLLTPDSTLKFEEQSRGRDPEEPNRLTLSRELWLDFDGSSYSVKDQLNGTMVRGWRLDMQAPYTLTRAQSPDENGQLEPLLITTGTGGSTGVEVRAPQVALQSSARLDATKVLPITGWQQTLDHAHFQLYTPPGWQLLAAAGSTESPGAWVENWNIFAVFAVALIAMLAWRVGGHLLGGVALAYLILAYFEPGAPVFSVLAVLLLILLARALSRPRFHLVARILGLAAFVVLVLAALPFIQRQAQLALHPQLEFDRVGLASDPYSGESRMGLSHASPSDFREQVQANAPMAPPPPPAPEPNVAMQQEASPESIQVTGSRIKGNDSGNFSPIQQQRAKKMQRYAANSVLQAGSAEPNWRWRGYQLSFAGPIEPAQTMRLWLLPPWLVGLLRLLTLALLGFLLWRLWQPGPLSRNWLKPWLPLVAALFVTPAFGQATPSPEILEELRTRLTRGELCAPECVSISEATVSIENDNLEIALVAHAGARSALALPLNERALSDPNLSVDGVADSGWRRSDGQLQVVLERGVHRVVLRAGVRADRVTLNFPLPPQRVLFAAAGWDSSGLRDAKLTSGTLDLVRVQKSQASRASGMANEQFPPFVRVHRTIRLDLEWRVETIIERLAPSNLGLTVRVPLLSGERPLGAEVQIVGNEALVPLQADAGYASFESALDRQAQIVLTAPALRDRAEVWTLEASPIWHVAYQGVPVALDPVSNPREDVRLRFLPLPGEQLALHLHRPEPAPGPAFRIDQVTVTANPGERVQDTVLAFTLQATQGGQHRIGVPSGAEVISVQRNESALPLRARQAKLDLPVQPGENRFAITVRESKALGWLTQTPVLDLGLPAANVSLSFEVPESRWLLWVRGPMLGPAILYWPTLLVLLGVALVLARSGRTPLGAGAWVLLGLGLTGFAWEAFAIVALWFLALQWRARSGHALSDGLFRLMQVGLVLLSVIAVGIIVAGVMSGLLANPTMQVVGNGSGERSLRWFADLSEGALPVASAYSMPLWCYKALMLAWALWLANALLAWLRWGWTALTTGGGWRAFPKRVRVVEVAPVPPPIPERAPPPVSDG